jgi:hypothetical protein
MLFLMTVFLVVLVQVLVLLMLSLNVLMAASTKSTRMLA